MSTSNKIAYGGSTSITITPGALASGSARQSAAVDNTTNLYVDAVVTVTINAPTSGLAAPFLVNVYAAASLDGSVWPGEGAGNPDGVTGSDATITLESPTNLTLLGQITLTTVSNTYVSEPFSVASCFGGVMPPHWSIVIQNSSGGALQSGSTAHYSGVYTTNG